MTHLDPEIYQRKLLYKQIYDSLHGDLIEQIFAETCDASALQERNIDNIRYEMPIEKDTLPQLYRICTEVKKQLHFKEPIDFFLISSKSINACSCESRKLEEAHHVIELNAGLVDIMSENELRFVIGHEIGHLISHDGHLKSLIHYVCGFKEEDFDQYISCRLKMYNLLAELVADRYGYLACNDEEASIMAMAKLGAGLDISRMGVSLDNLLKANKRHLKIIFAQEDTQQYSHPDHPIRIEALHIFSTSKTNEQVERRMQKIEDFLRQLKPQDAVLLKLLAAFGIKLAKLQDGLSPQTYHALIVAMGRICWFPEDFLEIWRNENPDQLLQSTIDAALDDDMFDKQEILTLLVNLTYYDDIITEQELQYIYEVAEYLQFPKDNVGPIIAQVIREGFNPCVGIPQ